MACYGVRGKMGMIMAIGIAAWLVGGLTARAADKETRVFSIKVDGKPAGDHHMTISRPDEHTTVVESRANVSVSYLLKKYKYTYRGSEVWKDGRLDQLESETYDDGKRYRVSAKAAGDQLRVRVNDREHRARPDVRTTTYWQLPEPQLPNQRVALLDCDTGEDLYGTVRYLGVEPLVVAGQTQNCAHYQISELHVDVWYDAQKRLVRERSLEDGHEVILQLTAVDR
jgi:hypothetical protein